MGEYAQIFGTAAGTAATGTDAGTTSFGTVGGIRHRWAVTGLSFRQEIGATIEIKAYDGAVAAANLVCSMQGTEATKTQNYPTPILVDDLSIVWDVGDAASDKLSNVLFHLIRR